jgi:exodeoxyribonuclease VII large subunit
MPEDQLTLSSLNRRIREMTESAFPQAVWVVAEILEMNLNRSGHCYLDLVEKSADGDGILARSRGTIWSFKYRMIRPYFESTTGEQLRSGIKVLLKAHVTFHEVYGMSLNIVDIDPSFTMGDLALKRKQVLEKLEADGVIRMNQELIMTEVPQRIAVISSETAAGLGDFIDSLTNNPYDFGFAISLFPAVVQGDEAESSIIAALDKVYGMEDTFDVVAIIRGGGSQADLECFNSYDLALNIAQFPLPVLTGIGHERDETVADIVAHRSLKTPTAVAEFLVDHLANFLEYLQGLQDRFSMMVKDILQAHKDHLATQSAEFHRLVREALYGEDTRTTSLLHRLEKGVFQVTMKEKNRQQNVATNLSVLVRNFRRNQEKEILSLAEKTSTAVTVFLESRQNSLDTYRHSLDLLHPDNVLKRGYSITYADGKILKSVADARKDDLLETVLKDGTIKSRIDDIQSKSDKK